MENVILKKINGELVIKRLEDLRKVKSSLIEIDECFDKIIDKESIKEVSKAEFDDAKKTINYIINSITTVASRHMIDESFEKLKTAKTKKDILNIISDVVVEFVKNHQETHVMINGEKSKITPDVIKNHLEPLLKSNPSLMISLFIKKITYAHYVGIFARISAPRAREILKVSRKDAKNGMKVVGDTFTKTAYHTGFYKLAEQMFLYNLELAISRNSKHLCWENCKNASPKLCPKIKDVNKKTIDAYPFIQDGYQKYNYRGELIDFCVSNCENYEVNNRKPRPFFTLGIESEDLYEGYMNLLRK